MALSVRQLSIQIKPCDRLLVFQHRRAEPREAKRGIAASTGVDLPPVSCPRRPVSEVVQTFGNDCRSEALRTDERRRNSRVLSRKAVAELLRRL